MEGAAHLRDEIHFINFHISCLAVSSERTPLVERFSALFKIFEKVFQLQKLVWQDISLEAEMKGISRN